MTPAARGNLTVSVSAAKLFRMLPHRFFLECCPIDFFFGCHEFRLPRKKIRVPFFFPLGLSTGPMPGACQAPEAHGNTEPYRQSSSGSQLASQFMVGDPQAAQAYGRHMSDGSDNVWSGDMAMFGETVDSPAQPIPFDAPLQLEVRQEFSQRTRTENIVSNLKHFRVMLSQFRVGPDGTKYAAFDPMRYRIELLCKNNVPVDTVRLYQSCPPLLLLAGDTELDLGNRGTQEATLKVGRSVTSYIYRTHKLPGEREAAFRLRVAPIDDAFKVANPSLTVVTHPFKIVTKLRPPEPNALLAPLYDATPAHDHSPDTLRAEATTRMVHAAAVAAAAASSRPRLPESAFAAPGMRASHAAYPQSQYAVPPTIFNTVPVVGIHPTNPLPAHVMPVQRLPPAMPGAWQAALAVAPPANPMGSIASARAAAVVAGEAVDAMSGLVRRERFDLPVPSESSTSSSTKTSAAKPSTKRQKGTSTSGTPVPIPSIGLLEAKHEEHGGGPSGASDVEMRKAQIQEQESAVAALLGFAMG